MIIKKLKEVFGRFTDYYFKINIYLNFAKYSNIAGHKFESIKLNKRDRGLKK